MVLLRVKVTKLTTSDVAEKTIPGFQKKYIFASSGNKYAIQLKASVTNIV